MIKAIILARVSTEEQKEANNSLPAQIAGLFLLFPQNFYIWISARKARFAIINS